MSKETENKKSANNGKSMVVIIVVLGIAFFISSVVLILALVGAFSFDENNEEDVNKYELTSSVVTESVTEGVAESMLAEDIVSVSDNVADSQSSQNEVVNSQQASSGVTQGSSSSNNKNTTIPATTKNAAIEYYEQLSPKGNNMLSDNCENEFIKLVSETYNVDSDLLVAVFSVPDNGDNFVLQFNGKKDGKGNYIKSPDTLEKIYQIDKSKNVKIATGKKTGNVGVSYGEGMLCFNMVKTVVMQQYPDYFTGLK